MSARTLCLILNVMIALYRCARMRRNCEAAVRMNSGSSLPPRPESPHLLRLDQRVVPEAMRERVVLLLLSRLAPALSCTLRLDRSTILKENQHTSAETRCVDATMHFRMHAPSSAARASPRCSSRLRCCWRCWQPPASQRRRRPWCPSTPGALVCVQFRAVST